ncbi:sigma-70 family RNA polymerase sigma factor [Thermus sp. SYSU G05001]|uniref:Sigma-70 family RNA polymerase sigma factor n=2 Tax=Thermus brevis TaxID=2862456 RepID=A0ABS6ZWP1_9DEIN|nr:sigma-70 family RNA polymerase sigma factor [Thermus caldilimi]MBW6394473.1 sigma-70 family RNA polymerase sigma factor [Thermus brevis]
MMGDTEDAELLRQVTLGNEEALLALYRRHASYVHALARRILRDKDEAKNVVQETFLRIWHKAEYFDPELGTPRTWILTIAHRLALKALKRRPDTLPLEDWDAPVESVGTEEHLDRIRVARALEALDGEERRLLELAYFYGYSHSDLALILGWPLGTVKSRLRRALKKLEVELR